MEQRPIVLHDDRNLVAFGRLQSYRRGLVATGSNFVARQVFFCGGDKDEFDAWKKGLNTLAAQSTRRRAEQTLKIQIDEDAFTRIYGHQSHPFPLKPNQKVAIRVISQFGEETTKVIAP